LPPDQRWEALSTWIANPLSVLHFGNPEGLTTTVWLHAFGIGLMATAAGGVAAWTLGRWLARRYGERRASDQMLTLDTLMLSFSLWVALVFATVFEWLIVASAVAGFIGYKLLAQWGLRYRRRGDQRVPARTLLLLRVFGFERRTQR